MHTHTASPATTPPQVVLAPDPDLAEHLRVHGVIVAADSTEGGRLQRALLVQVRVQQCDEHESTGMNLLA